MSVFSQRFAKRRAALVHTLFSFLLLGCLLPAQAQSNDSLARLKTATPQQRAQMQSDLMKMRLALNDAQYKQVTALNLAYALKIDPILKSDDGKFTKYGRIKPLLEEKESKLKTIFTKQQYEKYDAVKKEITDKLKQAHTTAD